MSVQVNTYVILGVELPYKPFKDRYDEFEPYMDSAFEGIKNHNGLCVLFDGMDGKYIIVGRVLAKTKNHGHFDGIVNLRELMPSGDALAEIERDIANLIGDGDKRPARIILVSHYR